MSRANTRTAVLLCDGSGHLCHAASDGLDEDYIRHVRQVAIRADQPNCGRAAATGEEVFTEDISREPAWAPFAHIMERFEISACWSFPIRTPDGVIGTIAIYHRDHRLPTPIEADAIRYLAQVAAQAVDHPHVTPMAG